jgi:acetyl-CoA acetyltransferase
MESLGGLKPVFPQWGEGSTTAGNASGIGDGAALCILTTRERAQREGMEIVGKWVGSSVVGMYTPFLPVG